MIIKASQRGGASQLANHLLNEFDNDHITVESVRGFAASDMKEAFAEAYAVSKGTRCKQFLFSVSLNPPKDASVGIDTLKDAARRVGQAVGLDGQPHTLVIHEKEGRRHAHVVWSRIDVDSMKAINLPFFKTKLMELSKELYLENGWELPRGHRENGWKNPLNFTLEEWQQAKRLGLDIREVKQLFQEAYRQSDSLAAFGNALQEHGYYLARGDSRRIVATDINGEIFSVGRYAGVRVRDLEGRFGKGDGLKPVEEVRLDIQARLKDSLRAKLAERKAEQDRAIRPLMEERAKLLREQRRERLLLHRGQNRRRLEENKARAARMHKGVRGVWEILTGRAGTIRRENESDAYRCYLRDRDQREALFEAQFSERSGLQKQLTQMRRQQKEERADTMRQVASLLRVERPRASERGRDTERDEGRVREHRIGRTLK
ncbi:MAG TPA: relaxase/mobilization nuclease domain-containing protein [Devosia sp.]|nr:relaxase/mobilization nuclease domain-containing protein [Devosia sp.]